MMRRFVAFFCPLLILVILSGRYFAGALTVRSGVRLLLAASVQETGKDSFSDFARLRYDNLIPVHSLSEEKGTIAVERLDDGRIRFVSALFDRPLRPRELLLKYVIVPPLPFGAKTQGPDIRFSSDFLRFFEEKTFQPSAVRYAVVRVDNAGNAVLTGLADNNGVLLVKGLIPAVSHTP
ncbi:MAG: hypothetical protein ACI4TE_01400 [Alphaproteobacteria bacterium]